MFLFQSDEYKRKKNSSADSDGSSMASLKWTTAKLNEIEAINEMQYDDAFTLQKVEDEHCHNFYFVAGMVPSIQKLIENVSFINKVLLIVFFLFSGRYKKYEPIK